MLEKIKFVFFIHIRGGVLYRMRTNSQILYPLPKFPKSLKPSGSKVNHTFWGSEAKFRYLRSKVFQASGSLGCLITSSLLFFSPCQTILLVSFEDINILFDLGINGKYRKNFVDNFFCRSPTIKSWSLAFSRPFFFYLDVWHVLHSFLFASSPQYNIQSLRHPCIIVWLRPILLGSFFAS